MGLENNFHKNYQLFYISFANKMKKKIEIFFSQKILGEPRGRLLLKINKVTLMGEHRRCYGLDESDLH